MQFDGGLVPPELRPRIERETEIDRGGIEGVGRLFQRDVELVARVESSGFANEDLRKVRIDAPVPAFVGVGQRALGGNRANARVVEFAAHRTEADFDVSQAVLALQLREGHAQELVPTGEVPNPGVAVIPVHTLVELVRGRVVHQLREDELSGVHRPLLFP